MRGWEGADWPPLVPSWDFYKGAWLTPPPPDHLPGQQEPPLLAKQRARVPMGQEGGFCPPMKGRLEASVAQGMSYGKGGTKEG